jgi:hypothetical protein
MPPIFASSRQAAAIVHVVAHGPLASVLQFTTG